MPLPTSERMGGLDRSTAGPLKLTAGPSRHTSPKHMTEIIIEGVLFVALVATVGALFYFVVLYFTPVGERYRQTRNRRRIDNAADLVCPIHGPRTSTELVHDQRAARAAGR